MALIELRDVTKSYKRDAIDIPVLDRKGRRRHDGGVVDAPGMYLMGMQFLRRRKSALIDGAGPLALFVRVVLPLLRPITGTAVILNAIFVWNDFLTPLLYLSGSNQQTIPVAIFGFVGQYTSNWSMVFAGLIIGVLPILIVYFLMQRRIIKGFAGGLKG